MAAEFFTIGHSNLTAEHFLSLLRQHGIEALVDIRRFPGSRKFTYFSRDVLAATLQAASIDYHWLESLGGRRRSTQEVSPNAGLENASFRAYADYMQTQGFLDGIEKLLEIAAYKRTALLCAESVYWRCHRRLVSDYLVANGNVVQHILSGGELRPHSVTRGANFENGTVTYPGEDRTLF